MLKGLLRSVVVASLYQSLIGLACPCFSRNVSAQITHDVAAFLNICGCPTTSLTVEKMRATTFQFENRGFIGRRLIDLAGMLGDQLSHHFKMTEFLDRDVL